MMIRTREIVVTLSLQRRRQITGGYLNKANGKFATVVGGSKNTVAGLYSVGIGSDVKSTGDNSMVVGLDPDATCSSSSAKTFSVCADSFVVNDVEIVDLFRRGRELADETSVSGGVGLVHMQATSRRIGWFSW
jgi:hypothetical protein